MKILISLNNNFSNLNVNVKSTIIALARNQNIKKIYLGVVKNKSVQSNRVSSKKILDSLAIWYDFYYKKNKNLYNLSLNQIDEFEKILDKKL